MTLMPPAKGNSPHGLNRSEDLAGTLGYPRVDEDHPVGIPAEQEGIDSRQAHLA